MALLEQEIWGLYIWSRVILDQQDQEQDVSRHIRGVLWCPLLLPSKAWTCHQLMDVVDPPCAYHFEEFSSGGLGHCEILHGPQTLIAAPHTPSSVSERRR